MSHPQNIFVSVFSPEALRAWIATLENRIDLDRFNPGLSNEIDSLVTRLEDS